jgi:hypothetical protein
MRRTVLLLALALPAAAALAAGIGRMDWPAPEAPFTDEAVVRGIQASKAQCDALPNAVWAQPAGEQGECLRYWSAGLDPVANPRVLVFFSGDLLVGNKVSRGYEGLTTIGMQKSAETVPARFGVPYIFLARPGTYGSSGEHKQRRRPAEARLVSAALDEIRKRHAIGELGVAGLSGGGHVVASLLGYRSDIVCAVAASAVSAPKLRVRLQGWSGDSTGYSDSYEPLEHLEGAKANPGLRVFVLGDPADSNVPWGAQTVLAERLQAMGIPAEVLQGEGIGPEHHILVRSALEVGAMCLKGQGNQEIRARSAQGFKG